MALPKILVFAGSIRSGALSAKLAALAAKEIALADGDVTQISLADYPLPIYDGDLEASKGVPENVQKLGRLFAASHGIFIATPEYNHSLPPLLKNTLDWVSRVRASSGVHVRGKVYAIGSTSDGPFGGARALLDLRKVLVTGLGAIVISERIEVPRAQDAFNEAGELIPEAAAKLMKTVARRLVEVAGRMGDAV
jgi:NAD(P)H-dependent FMN reductase